MLPNCGKDVKSPSVLIITIDTVRADRLGPYGKVDAGTPNLDKFATEAHIFEQAFTVAPVTTPSHASIMTGTYPPFHGVRDNGFFQLPDDAVTMAEVFSDHGYQTGAVVASYPLDRRFNISQGFTFYDDHINSGQAQKKLNPYFDERTAIEVNEAFLPWLREHADQPFFAWVHYWDAHQPLRPPSPFRDRFHYDPYQGEISYVDYAIGQVLDLLRQQKVYDDTVVVVVGDHGEGLGQHGEYTHALLAYNSTLHVPLMIKGRAQKQAHRIKSWVSTVDIMPTIIDMLNIPALPQIQGHSRTSIMWGKEQSPVTSSALYAEGLSGRISHDWGELRVLFVPPYKLIYGPRPELYDLETDPLETVDLSEKDSEMFERMTQRLAALSIELDSEDDSNALGEIDPEVLARLASLGYVSSPRDPIDIKVNEVLKSDGPAPQDMVSNNTLESLYQEYVCDGRFVDALAPAQQLYKNYANPKHAALLASVLFQLGRFDPAINLVEQTKTWLPYFPQPLLIGSIYVLSEQHAHDRALSLANRLVHEIPSANAYLALAQVIKKAGSGPYGEPLEKALALDPAHTGVLFELAVMEMGLGDTESAIKTFRRLVDEEPYVARHVCNLGLAYMELGDDLTAQRLFDRSLKLDPSYANAYLASLSLAVKRSDKEAMNLLFDKLLIHCRQPDCLEKAQALMDDAK